MKRDGRKLAHNTLEELRVLAVTRMSEGEHPAAVAASLGLNRSWAYKCRAMAKGSGHGLKALRSTKGTGRPRKLTPAQERQVFGWVNGKRPDEHGFDAGLWTRQIVRELVLARFGVELLAGLYRRTAGPRLGLTPQKPLERACQRDAQAVERWKRETFPAIAREAKSSGANILFWDESGFRADAVHGKTWAVRGQRPIIERPGQRQSISAASAVSAKGAFWFAIYQGALTGEMFAQLLEKMMHRRKKPVRLVLDGLPAHKNALVKDYVASTAGKLTLHFLPGYAPDLNPDELVCSHAKRTGVARSPLKAGERLQCRVHSELQNIANNKALVKSFFRHPSVSYISDS
ncbi:MAG: IS630 family transposase [Polaromonas sp.]